MQPELIVPLFIAIAQLAELRWQIHRQSKRLGVLESKTRHLALPAAMLMGALLLAGCDWQARAADVADSGAPEAAAEGRWGEAAALAAGSLIAGIITGKIHEKKRARP